MSDPHWVQIASGVADAAQVAAIVLGAIWAYFKFVRSRTFASRLELAVEGVLLNREDDYALLVTSSLRNQGLVRVRLQDYARSAYVYGLDTSQWRPDESVEWGDHLRVERIFEDHEWIEAQETITDRCLIPVRPPPDPADRWLALRIKSIVASKRQKVSHKAFVWTSVVIVPCDFLLTSGNPISTTGAMEGD